MSILKQDSLSLDQTLKLVFSQNIILKMGDFSFQTLFLPFDSNPSFGSFGSPPFLKKGKVVFKKANYEKEVLVLGIKKGACFFKENHLKLF